jgi:hypothetical protein
MASGTCPKCERVVSRAEIERISITEKSRRSWHGVSYFCPSCRAILGVGIDPIAIQSDIVAAISDQLRTLK